MWKQSLLSVALVVAVFAGVEANATVGNLTIQNDSNVSIWCAFTQYDQGGTKWITYSWFNVPNGQVRTFNNVTYYRCEQEGNPQRAWHNRTGNQRPFCVPRGANHVNPYHKSEDFNSCKNFGGEWQMFGLLPNQGAFTKYINP